MEFKLEYFFDEKNPSQGKCFLVRENSGQIAMAIFKELNSIDIYRNFNIIHTGKRIGGQINDMMSIELLKVNPYFQNKGIGKQLVKAIIEKAKEARCNYVFVRAEPFPDSLMSFNELVGWYKKFGFIELKKISSTEQLMTLVLK